MKILVITFSYRPLNNPRSFRWTFLTEELIRLGHQVDVVTSLIPGEPEIETRGQLTVYRTGWKFIENLRARQRNQRAAEGSKNQGAPSRLGRLRGTIIKKIVSLWRAVHWPDASCQWYYPARRQALALLTEKKHNIVISVAPSFTGVAVGKALKAKRPDLRWVLDLGDPFSFLEGAPPNNTRLYGRFNVRYERSAFRSANAISVTTPQTLARYEIAFPEAKGKINVIPPLLSLPKLPEDIVPIRGKLVYVGTLYRHIREPDYLLELFARGCDAGLMPPVELHFYGDISACRQQLQRYENRLEGRIHLHGQVSRGEVAIAMAEADVLINIGNDTTYQLPSKVVEYAASGKRIINLAKSEQDSSVLFFQNFPLALNLISTGACPTTEDVDRFVEFVSSSAPSTSFDLENWLAPYQPDRIVGEYIKLLQANHA